MIERANRKGVTIKKMIEQYLEEYEKIRPLGKTKKRYAESDQGRLVGRARRLGAEQSEAGGVCAMADE